jgi:cell wall-associated NlpC family hydrolase
MGFPVDPRAPARKRALEAHARLLHPPLLPPKDWNASVPWVGKSARVYLKEFQTRVGLPITAEFDGPTLAVLFPSSQSERWRAAIVANAKWGVLNKDAIHYSQSGARMAAVHEPRHLPLYTDCSAFITLCYSWAGAPDPNGLRYNGYGFTGTMLWNCRHIQPTQAKPGDIIVFGNYPGTHAVVIVGNAGFINPLCVSHGQEAGPILVELTVEKQYHAGQTVTFLSCI